MATNGKLRACNDPLRPEWGILSDLLGRAVNPGETTAEQAAQQLKGHLFEAVGRDPSGFIAKMLHQKGSDHSAFAGLRREYADRPGGWTAAAVEIADRLVAPLDGKNPVVTDRERVSSYHALSWWDPAKGGLVPYMRQRIQWVMQAMGRERLGRSRLVSVEALNAVGLELDETGEFRRDLSQPSSATSAEELAGSDSEAPEGVARNRSEFALFSAVLGHEIVPADSPTARGHQLRDLAVTAHRVEHGGLGDQDVERLLVAWDPASSTFRATFPGLWAEFRKFQPAPVPSEAVPRAPALEVDAVERLALAPEGSRLLPRLARAAQRFWSAHAVSEVELANPARPDYEYLALVTGRDVDADPPEQRLFHSIRQMATDWAEHAVVQSEGRLAGRVTALRRAVADYDPAKDGFLGEYLRDPEVWKQAPCPLPTATELQAELFAEAFGAPALVPAAG